MNAEIYARSQKLYWESEAVKWSPEERDPCVGSFDEHNRWLDYDLFLFKGVETKDKVGLDFGCGPGRNLVRYGLAFARLDGVDIAPTNLIHAKTWTEMNGRQCPTLYETNGLDLRAIPSQTYDVVMSTISLQHISVYDVRRGLLEEFFRVLKSGGAVCFQMGHGGLHGVPYRANYYGGGTDTRIDDPAEIRTDLEEIGYVGISYDVRPVGPGDRHGAWLFVRGFTPR